MTFLILAFVVCILALPLFSYDGFSNPYLETKWILLGLMNIVVWVIILIQRSVLIIPRWPLVYLLITCLFLSSAIVNFTTGTGVINESLFQRLFFLCFVVGLANIFAERRLLFLTLGAVFTAAIVYLGHLYYIAIFTNLAPLERLRGLLGNENLSAQYLSYALLLALGTYASLFHQNRSIKVIFSFVSVLTLAILVLIKCRSVLLGLPLSILSLLVLMPGALKLKKIIILLLFFAITGTVSILKLNFPPAPKEIFAVSDLSSRSRFMLWQGSFEMFKNHPMGIGSGRFHYSFLPYQAKSNFPIEEHIIEPNPHNEWLRILVEEGYVFFALVLFLIGFLFRHLITTYIGTTWLIALPICIFTLTESIFQFPLLMPMPLFFLAIIIALLLRDHMLIGANIKMQPWVGSIVLVMLILSTSLLTLNAVFLSSVIKLDLVVGERLCRLMPSNFELCHQVAIRSLEVNDLSRSERTMQQTLKIEPYFFPGISLWSEIEFKLDRIDEACIAMNTYNKLFYGKSSVDDELKGLCSKDESNTVEELIIKLKKTL